MRYSIAISFVLKSLAFFRNLYQVGSHSKAGWVEAKHGEVSTRSGIREGSDHIDLGGAGGVGEKMYNKLMDSRIGDSILDGHRHFD